MGRTWFRSLGVLGAALAATMVVGCAPPPPGDGGGPAGPVTWIIPAGSHEAVGSSVELTTTDELHFRARFDGSAQYSTTDPANQADINKLRGLSDCSAHHHTASARFGWRWAVDRIEILAYTYVAGVRSSVVLGTVAPGEWHDYRLTVTASGYEFRLDGALTTVPRGCSTPSLAKYQLWPYFGGDETAPHEIRIEIDRPTG